MSEFELRPEHAYAAPRYPASEAPGEAPKAPMIGNRLSALAPAAILVVAAGGMRPVRSHGADVQTVEARPQAHVEAKLVVVTEAEASGVLEALQDAKVPMPPQGDPAPPSSFLTEGEARTVLEEFLKTRGMEGRAVDVRGLRLTAYDAATRTGVAVSEEQPAGALDEAALLRARGEMKVLVLHRSDWEYDKYGAFGGSIPRQATVVERLRAELERFLERP